MKKRTLAFLLAFVMILGCFAGLGAGLDSDTVTVTVNFVYKSNNAMVAQPYSAKIAKGDPFKATVSAPNMLNYSVPVDEAEGLGDGIEYSKDDAGNGFVKFDLASVTEDITVNLFYVAGQAKYTVNHHYQNIADDEYGQVETVELVGDIDAYTAAVAESKPGFICKGVPEYVIAADGKTTVNIYYDRIYYTVVFDVNGGINGPKPVYGKYGADLTVSSTPTRAGYTFAGWDKTVTKTIVGNVTYKAQWIANEGNSKYAIVLWGQNANDNEYSYLDTVTAFGAPGDTVTWDESKYICEGAHTHSAACYDFTCKQEEHTHSATCGLDCKHTHTLSCFGLSNSLASVNANDGKYGDGDAATHFENKCTTCGSVFSLKESGSVCKYTNGYRGFWGNDKYEYFYFFYYQGRYYEITEAQYNNLKSAAGNSKKHGRDTYEVYDVKSVQSLGTCTHTHDDSCYKCGKTEHTHSALGGSCYTLTCKVPSHTHNSSCKKMGDYAPDSNLWKFVSSETVTIDADGTTVLNVYFVRKEFTLTFNYRTTGNWDDGGGTKKTEKITARWGADILDQYNQIKVNSGNGIMWSKNSTSQYEMKYTSYFEIMPSANATYYLYRTSGDLTNKMSYYCADLNGEYQLKFSLEFYSDWDYFTVTEQEDYFKFEGFEIRRDLSAKEGDSCQDAKFYYDRISYKLDFFSASKSEPDKTEMVKYQKNLGQYNYTPTSKPANMEADAVFVGWYLNPECTGEKYDLSAHSMPAANVALYAKWVKGLYTVKTFTDESMTDLYKYDGYSGVQNNIIKYTTAPVTPNDPKMSGNVFAGWFYKDADGSEQPFSFVMPITQDYDLYPKFTNQAIVSYTVRYLLKDGNTPLADERTNSAMIGSSVTEKAKMGDELNLAEKGHNYFPDKTSTSVVLDEADMVITFYYSKDIKIPYTVKYVDEDNQDLIPPKVVSDNEFSVVTESYVPIDNYAPNVMKITKELTTTDPEKNNIIVFVYKAVDYTITYDPNGGTMTGKTQTKYNVNSTVTIADAPERNGYIFAGWQLAEKTGNWEAGTYNPAQRITEGKYGNVTLVAQWNEKTAVINYEVVGPEGCGSVSPTSETVNMVTGTANGSTATASNDAYKFVGWYSDQACKNLVSSDAEYVPTKSGTLWPASTTYYAKFDWNVADLTIKKTGANDIDKYQSFIFHVTGEGKDMYVTVQGNGSVTIKGLTVGTYTVKEVTSWSWRYKPDKGSQDVEVKGGQPNEVTFNNSRTNGSWLSGDSFAINRTDGRH